MVSEQQLKKEYEIFRNNLTETCNKIDLSKLDLLVENLLNVRNSGGRLFLAGMGGSAANASHATNDFRKICGINAICLTDNISEFSARINDEDKDEIFVNIIKLHDINEKDLVMIFSVGGGSKQNNTSINLYNLIKFAKSKKSTTCSIVGKSKCLVKKFSDIFISFNLDNCNQITPLSETLQVFVWHFICSYEKIKINKTKW